LSAIGLLGQSERTIMQRYSILVRMRKQFSMPDAAFEDTAAYLNLINDPDTLDYLAVTLEEITSNADALTLVAETAHRCREKRQSTIQDLGDTVRFDPRGRRNLYQSIVDEVGQMTVTQRSLGALGRRLRQTELLIQKGCSILTHLDKDILMARIVSVARQLLSADISLAMLLDEQGEPGDYWVDGTKKQGLQFPPEMKFLMQSLNSREILLIENLQNYMGTGRMPPEHINIQRVVSAPLMVRGAPVGILAIGKTTYAPLFDAEDLKLLDAFLKQVSAALENVHLHDVVTELAQMQERQRIAQDLHDSIVQHLFVTGMETESLLAELPAHSPLRHKAQRIRRLISRSTADLRGAIGALTRGPMRKDAPLSVLLQELIEEFENTSQIETTLITLSEWPELSERATQAIYRIVRESLANIQKHARASAVVVGIASYLDRLVLSIQDNGVGFPQPGMIHEYSDLHFGMRTMHQLAQQAGGYLETLNNEDGGGALVRFTLPRIPTRTP
jgi:signal transduction histidine kinase